MVKFCMLSMLRLWSLVGSVTGCWAKAAPTTSKSKRPTQAKEACVGHPRTMIPTLCQNRGKDGAPTVLSVEAKRPTRPKDGRVGHPGHPAKSRSFDSDALDHPTKRKCGASRGPRKARP